MKSGNATLATLFVRRLLVGLLLAACAAPLFSATPAAPLRAGAAKIEITPKTFDGINSVWSTKFQGVHDPIFARALVVDNGLASAAIVATDLVENGDTLALRQRIQRELGIAADRILITASHDHNAPRSGPITLGTSSEVGRPASSPEYSQFVDDSIVLAVKQAKVALQPARVGVGQGRADINVNRIGFNGRGFGGADPNGDSDKTVWVVKFETPAGEPIAILMNYSVHSVLAGAANFLITGDLAGAAERFVERQLKDKAVALWSMGAAGDQNPKWDTNVAADKNPQFAYEAMDALGAVVGAEVIQTANRIKRMSDAVTIAGGESILTCKNQQRSAQPPAAGGPPQGPGALAGNGAPTGAGKPPAGAPPAGGMMANPTTYPPTMDIHLGLIRINQIALTGVSGEIFTPIYWHLKKDTPLTNTILLTMANGRIGYIADDASYAKQQHNVSLEQGCAENGIVNGLVELMEKSY